MAGGSLPVVSGKRVIQALMRAGFVAERIVGSHDIMMHPTDPNRDGTRSRKPRSQAGHASRDRSAGGIQRGRI
jgi:predicted RNA binding protein YcfA (HicA-like mRNA interferase family)